MSVSPAHEVVGLTVFLKAPDGIVTREQMWAVLDELSEHDPETCGCGTCSWLTKSTPARVYRSALNWARQATDARARAHL